MRIHFVLIVLFLFSPPGVNANNASVSVSFAGPTPVDGSSITFPDYAYLNASVNASGVDLTGFIDCNGYLLGWWRFNGESGENSTFFRDWSGYKNDAKCSGSTCPSYTSGRFGGALLFDGSNDYVYSSKLGLNSSGQITIEAWIKSPYDTVHSGHIVSSSEDATKGTLILKRGQTSNYLIWEYSNGTSDSLWFGDDDFFQGFDDVLLHVAVTADYDSGVVIFYRNGVEVYRNQMKNPVKPRKDQLWIGTYSGGTSFFKGAMDEVRVWKRVLSPWEVRASFDAGDNRLYRRITSETNTSYSCVAHVENSAGIVNSSSVLNFSTKSSAAPFFVLASGPAITNVKVLAQNNPFRDADYDVVSVVSLKAAPGEYEPASLVVYSNRNLTGLAVNVSGLSYGSSTIPSSNIDVRVVKVWWQAGTDIWDSRNNLSILSPELLLHDDSLVVVNGNSNYVRGYNCGGCYVNVSYPYWSLKYVNGSGYNSSESYLENHVKPEDSAYLLPVNVSSNNLKQFWITVHVPVDASPGVYDGTALFYFVNESSRLESRSIHLRVEVLPFTLEDPAVYSSIDYLSVISPKEWMTELRTPEQIGNEMTDMREHGIDNPTIYQQYDNLSQYLTIRSGKGFKTDKIFHLGIYLGDYYLSHIPVFKSDASKFVNLSRYFGYNDVYVYGLDEAQGSSLSAERNAFAAAHEVGAKTFVSCFKDDCFNLVGDVLDMASLEGYLNSSVADQFHSVGHQVFSYANPQFGVEDPEIYRRNYGTVLWKSGYDGAMDFAYQRSFGNPWNDYDDEEYRDHMMTYPTQTGVIDTIQWEGAREGIDDNKYLATLLKYINLSRARSSNARALGLEAETWLNNTDYAVANLYDAREDMISRIESIRVALGDTTTSTSSTPTTSSPTTSTTSSTTSSSTTRTTTTPTTSTTSSHSEGDADGDGHVDYNDLIILAASYGKQSGDGGFDPRADFNADAVVDYNDLIVLAAHYGT